MALVSDKEGTYVKASEPDDNRSLIWDCTAITVVFFQTDLITENHWSIRQLHMQKSFCVFRSNPLRKTDSLRNGFQSRSWSITSFRNVGPSILRKEISGTEIKIYRAAGVSEWCQGVSLCIAVCAPTESSVKVWLFRTPKDHCSTLQVLLSPVWSLLTVSFDLEFSLRQTATP